jgi:hypothetical protein
MSTFKAGNAFVIRGRGLVLSGHIVDGIVSVGMSLTVESFPRPLTIDGLEMINTLHKEPGLIGLFFQSTNRQEMELWKSLDVKDKVFEVSMLNAFRQ